MFDGIQARHGRRNEGSGEANPKSEQVHICPKWRIRGLVVE
jgi:hypothetical protein